MWSLTAVPGPFLWSPRQFLAPIYCNVHGKHDWYDCEASFSWGCTGVGIGVPFSGFWRSPSNICCKLYSQSMGDVQLGHLPTPALYPIFRQRHICCASCHVWDVVIQKDGFKRDPRVAQNWFWMRDLGGPELETPPKKEPKWFPQHFLTFIWGFP